VARSSLGLGHGILNDAVVRRAVDGAVHVGERPEPVAQSHPERREALHRREAAQELGVGEVDGAGDVVGKGFASARGAAREQSQRGWGVRCGSACLHEREDITAVAGALVELSEEMFPVMWCISRATARVKGQSSHGAVHHLKSSPAKIPIASSMFPISVRVSSMSKPVSSAR